MLLGFVGIDAVWFIYAQGRFITAEQKEKSLQSAQSEHKVT